MFLSHTSDLSKPLVGRSFVGAAKQAIIDAGDGLVEMESFGPSDTDPAAMSASMVARADIYVGIIGLHYGSLARERPERSYTELEYETAASLEMPQMIFLLDERSEDVPRPAGPSQLDERQLAFRARLLDTGVTVAIVATPEELSRRLLRALFELPDRAAIPNELSLRALADARRHLLRQVRDLMTEQARSSGHLQGLVLGLAERPAAAYRPHVRMVLRRRAGPDRPLPRNRPADTLFRELGGQLLVLGEPGAGKTNLLLELAGRLADDAARSRSEPMPVVLHLASWAAGRRRPFDRWVHDELHRTYGLSPALSHHWIAERLMVLLLDGLDEVDPAHREACVEAINSFRRQYAQLPLAVCSRTAEFESLHTRLQLPAAVVILPLERHEVEGYLRAAGPSLAGLQAALRRDDPLWDLLTTPLFLEVVAVAYRDRSPDEIDTGASLDELRATVLSAYVERMLERLEAEPDARYRREDLLCRLRWLAGVMTARAQSVFHLDLIQPDWLPTVAQRGAVTIGVSGAVGLLTGLLVGVILWVGTGLTIAPRLGPAYVLVAATITGLGIALVPHRSDIEPTMELGWCWRTLRSSLPGLIGSSIAVAAVLGSGLGLVAAFGRLIGLDADLGLVLRRPAFLQGMLVLAEVAGSGVGVGLVVALTAGISERYAVDPPGPGRAMRASRRSWWLSTLAVGMPVAGLFLLAIDVLGAEVIPRLSRGYEMPPVGTIDTFLSSLAAGVLAGLAGGPLISGILPATRRPQLRRGLCVGASAAAILGPAQLAIAHALDAFGVTVQLTLVPGLQAWMFASAAAGLIVAVGGSSRSGVVYGLVAAFASGAIVVQRATSLLDPGPVVVAFTVAMALCAGLRRGGGAVLRHWVLRWWLARAGRLPLDAVPFLELATRIGLLRRRGGGYQFFHRLLQEHFATRPDCRERS